MTVDEYGMEYLDESQCLELLASQEHGRLAIAIANHPDIFPINHVVDEGTVVFRTAEGTKLAAAVLGSSVAYEVDGYEPSEGIAWSVVVKGRAMEIEALEDLLRSEDLPLFPWHVSPKRRFVRIVPAEITGRRFHVVRQR
ncbi:MAG: pyridoxamine 5'-phosphate oxidase family protein [Actinobacteria bacterium]|nr:pyridoxamine 5'-phosphate oxidase family protein [Actinomycetota bacterium]